jgi:hypothetical protein
MVRIKSVVARGGEADGVRLLSPKTIDWLLDMRSHKVNRVLGIALKIGVGYRLL